MIIYNVGRKWFAEKSAANMHRVSLRLKPATLVKITIKGRDDLAALLNALCEPPFAGKPVPNVIPVEVIDRTFADPHRSVPDCVPRFLLDDEGKKAWDERHAEKEPDLIDEAHLALKLSGLL